MSTEPVGWIATFRDGPLAGDPCQDRVFAVGEPWQSMTFALGGPTAHPWILVGGDGIPRDPDDELWPGEFSYRLADTITMAGMHGEPVAYYELEP